MTNESQELSVDGRETGGVGIEMPAPVCSAEKILEIRKLLAHVYVEPGLWNTSSILPG